MAGMVNGLLAGIYIAAAAASVGLAVRLFRRSPSLSLLSYSLYLAFWNFLNVFTTAFLLYIRYLPKTGRLGFILFNAVFLIPVHAATAFFFADFLWKRLGRRLTWAAKAVLAAPFLAVLVTYGRQAFIRLSTNPAPDTFQVSAPLSLRIMILIVFGLSLAVFLVSAAGKDPERKRDVMPVAGLTAAGILLGVVFMTRDYTDFLSYLLSGLAWLAVNLPALVALALSARRKRLAAAGGGDFASRLEEIRGRFGLSEREGEILASVLRGRLNKEIAGELHISLDTVKKHLYNIFKKTAVRNRLQLFLLVQGGEFATTTGGRQDGRDRIPD